MWNTICQPNLNKIFNPRESTYFVVKDSDDSIEHHSFLARSPIHSFRRHRDWIHAIYISPDKLQLVSAEHRTAFLWTISTGAFQEIIYERRFSAVTFTWDNLYLLTGDTTGVIHLCTRSDALKRAVLRYHGSLDLIIVTMDGKYMLASDGPELCVWDLEAFVKQSLTYKPLEHVPEPAKSGSKPRKTKKLPNVVPTLPSVAPPVLWQAEPIRRINIGEDTSCALSPDCKYLVVASFKKGLVSLLDFTSGNSLWSIPLMSPSVTIAQPVLANASLYTVSSYSFITLSGGIQATEWEIAPDLKSLQRRSSIFDRSSTSQKTSLIAHNDSLVLYHVGNVFHVHNLKYGLVWKGETAFMIGSHPLFELR